MSLTNAMVEVQPAGVWEDITGDVTLADGITITRGRGDWGARVAPTSLALTLLNPDGKYSPRNPYATMPLPRNTPLRVSVQAGASYLAIADTVGDRASTPDTAALDVTGDLDVRVEARLADWTLSDIQALIGKYNTVGNQRSFRLVAQAGRLWLTWSPDGTTFIEKQSTIEFVVPPSRRLAVRATLDVNNGSAGNTVTFFTAPSIAGPWTRLGDPVVTAGTTSIFASTTPLEVGAITALTFLAPVGQILAAEVRNGLDGTIVANPDFTAQAPGAGSFVDGSGRTWTVGGNATLSNKRVRFTGEITTLPSDSHVSGHNVRAKLTAYGELRRYSKGSAAQQSTLRRRIPAAVPPPLVYWPLEDGERTVSPASALSGGRPLTVKGLQFAQDASLGGSAPLPTLNNPASLYGAVRARQVGWHAEMVYRLDTMPAAERTLLRLYLASAGSGVKAVRVRCSTAGIRVQALDDDDNIIANALFSDPDAIADFSPEWNRLQLYSYDDGPNTFVCAGWRNITDNSFWVAFTSFAGSPGKVTAVRGEWGSEFSGMPIGHLAVWDIGASSTTTPGVTIYNGADDGYAGESAISRIIRVAAEADLPMRIYDGDRTLNSQLVGPQGVDEALTLIESAVDVDGGILYEERDRATLAYRDRSGLYNQPPALVLAYKGDGLTTPLTPAPDDQNTVNDVTVTRTGGASARVVVEEGPLSVLPPPDGVGRYDKGYDLNLYADEQAELNAGWYAHLGTWDEERYPQVTLKLTKATHAITGVAEVDVGDRLQIVDAPLWRSPGTIDLIAQGYTETIKPYQWDIAFNCQPAGPWSVGVVEDARQGHIATDGSELAAAVGTADTEVPVAVTAGPGWTAANLSLNGNPRVAADLTGWTGNGATLAREAVSVPAPVDAPYAIRITPDGVAASGGANGAVSAVGTVTVGASYTVSCWAYSPGGWSDLRAAVDWYDAAGVYLSSSLGSATVVPAASWTFLSQTFTAPASSSRAVVRARHSGTPPASAFWYATQITVRRTRADEVLEGFPVDVLVGGEVMTVEAITGDAARDGFDRVATSGWGMAEEGGAWSTSGGSAADYSCNGTSGLHNVATANVNRFTLLPAARDADFDLRVDVSSSALAVGAAQQAYLIARFADTSNYYGARVEFGTSQQVTVTLIKVVAGLATSFTVHTTALTHAANTPVRLRFQGRGSTLRAKAWLPTAAEPASWQVTQVDTALTAAGQYGCRTRVLTGGTVPAVIAFDGFRSVQAFAAARAVTGIELDHPAAEPVQVANPLVVAL